MVKEKMKEPSPRTPHSNRRKGSCLDFMIAPDGLFVTGRNNIAATARALLAGLSWWSSSIHALGGPIRSLLATCPSSSLPATLLVPAADVVIGDMAVLAAVAGEGFVVVARLRVGGDDVPGVQQAGDVSQHAEPEVDQ